MKHPGDKVTSSEGDMYCIVITPIEDIISVETGTESLAPCIMWCHLNCNFRFHSIAIFYSIQLQFSIPFNCNFWLHSRKYEERCAREGVTFTPLPKALAVDTLGGWHPIALETIARLGRQLARNIGKEEVECVRHLRQRLAILLVRDNVALCTRTPTFTAMMISDLQLYSAISNSNPVCKFAL